MLFKLWATRRVDKIINDRLKKLYEKEQVLLPAGFYPADEVRKAHTQWVTLPWGSSAVTVQLRTLGAGEFPDVSLLDLTDKFKKAPTYNNRAKLINLQLEYCKKAMVSPTYKEAEEKILEDLPKVKEGKEAYEKLLKTVKLLENEEERREVQKELAEMSTVYGCLFPPNFISAVTAWVECLDLTDIKKLDEEKLIQAHALSLINKNRASDNLQGVFLERTRNEIDVVACNLYNERKKKK